MTGARVPCWAPWALVGALLTAALPRPARAFGDAGAFDPRVLLTGAQVDAARPDAPRGWSVELEGRTSAPTRRRPSKVHADDPALTDGPFVYWNGEAAPAPLTIREVAGLRGFFSLGGVMLVDDATPGEGGAPGPFGTGARAEIARVLPDSVPIPLGPEHVIYHSFYLLPRPVGRLVGSPSLDAIVRGGRAQVLFAENDLGGALARGLGGGFALPVVPGGEAQREQAVRLAVNLAMYVLCSNYKDDQVHAQSLMRRGIIVPSIRSDP